MKFDPNDPRLTAYVLGELDEAEREVVETLLETCPESRRVVEEIRRTAELLTAELKQETCLALTPQQRAAITVPPVPTKRRFLVRHWKPLAAAASVMLIVGVGIALSRPSVRRARIIATTASAPSDEIQRRLSVDIGAISASGEKPGLRMEQEGIFWGGEDAEGRSPRRRAFAPTTPGLVDMEDQNILRDSKNRALIQRQRALTARLGTRLTPSDAPAESGSSKLRDLDNYRSDHANLEFAASSNFSDQKARESGKQHAPAPEPSTQGEMQEFETSLSMVINEREPQRKGTVRTFTRTSPGSDAGGRARHGALGRLIEKTVRVDSWDSNGVESRSRGRDEDKRVYYFGDPIKNVPASPAEAAGIGGGVVADFDPLIELIEKTVEVDSWDPKAPGAMQEFETTLSLVINQTQSLPQQQVDELRRANDPRELLEKIKKIKGARREHLHDHNTEAYARIVDNPFLAVGSNPLSTFSIDVDTASYANVRRFLNQGMLPPPDAVRIEELVNYFQYDYPAPTGDVPFSSHVEVAGCPWAPEHRLVRVALKGREIEDENRPATNLVFLLDVSGSMSPQNKLPLLKKAMRLLVERLGENDRVAIVVYAGASGLVLPSTTANNQETILSALDELHAGGSTNGGSGIQLAYDVAVSNFIKGGVNRVILATDGDFNVGVTNEGQLHRLIEQKAKSGVFLSVLGFGMGNLKDSNLEMLADKGNGNYAYIDTAAEARKVLVEEMGGTLVTIAKDVKIQIEFNPNEVAAYRLIGYENRVLAAEDFNDDTKDAGEIGAGHTVTALYEIVPAGEKVELPKVDELKYQKRDELAEAAFEGELLELKLRYKEPDGEVSKLLKFPVEDEGKGFGQTSDDFKFAASVAAFGMLLRGSPYKGNATLDAVLEMADDGKGADRLGYRAEFLDLVKKAKTASR